MTNVDSAVVSKRDKVLAIISAEDEDDTNMDFEGMAMRCMDRGTVLRAFIEAHECNACNGNYNTTEHEARTCPIFIAARILE